MMKSKLKMLITISLSLLLVAPSFSIDDEKVLRTGSCWCDGQSNCREKPNGEVCGARDACSALACFQIAAIVVAGVVAGNTLSQ